jgi:hypothetical protein
MAAELVAAAPWCDRAAYRPTVAAWCRVEAQLHILTRWLDEHGLLDEEGRPRPATNLADRLEGRAARLRAELGLTPMSQSRLLLNVAAVEGGQAGTLDVLLAEGRQALSRAAERPLGAS